MDVDQKAKALALDILRGAIRAVHEEARLTLSRSGVDSDALVLHGIKKADRRAMDYLLSAREDGDSVGEDAHFASLVLGLVHELGQPDGSQHDQRIEATADVMRTLARASALTFEAKENLEKGFWDVVEVSATACTFRLNEGRTLGAARFLAAGERSTISELESLRHQSPVGPSHISLTQQEAIGRFELLDSGELRCFGSTPFLDEAVERGVAIWEQAYVRGTRYFAEDSATTKIEGITFARLRHALRNVYGLAYRRWLVLQIRASKWPSQAGAGLVWHRTPGEWALDLADDQGLGVQEMAAFIDLLSARPRSGHPSDFLLQNHPFVPLKNGRLAVGAYVVQSLKATEVLVDLLSEEARAASGPRFESAIAEDLRFMGATARSNWTPSGLSGDVDVIAVWGPRILVFECKAQGGHMTIDRASRWRDELEKEALDQIKRSHAFVAANRAAVAVALDVPPEQVASASVVSGIISASYAFDGATLGDFVVRDGPALFRTLRSELTQGRQLGLLLGAFIPNQPSNARVRESVWEANGIRFARIP